MNRQVWKLKEYELPFDPYQNSPVSPNAGSVVAGSAILSNSDNGHPNASALGSTRTASISMSSSSSHSFYEPLTEGKWRDGWLPPAEALQWRFPDDCGDELEIVESVVVVVVDGDPSARRRTTMESSLQGSSSSSSKGGDDEDSIGWEKERAGFSGRIRGRVNARQRNEARAPGLAIGQGPKSESVTPVGLKVSHSVEGAAAAAASPREIPTRTDTTSPRSPEFDTTAVPTSAGFGGRRRETGVDEYSFEDTRRPGGPSRTTTEELEGNPTVANEGGSSRVVEKVSRYIRWDPNVAWARQAIWGSPPASSSSSAPSTSGHSRGSQGHASNAGSKNKGGEWMVGRVRRRIRDILIFGEVSGRLRHEKTRVLLNLFECSRTLLGVKPRFGVVYAHMTA
jgi:hypothetical protein